MEVRRFGGLDADVVYTGSAGTSRPGLRGANNVGCTVLFKVAPASAILDGPLPSPPARTIQVGLPTTAVRGTATQVTLSGSAYQGDKIGYRLIRADEGPCPSSSTYPSASQPARSTDTWSDALLTGTYSTPFPITLPKETGNYIVCAWLQNTDDSGLTPIAANAGLAVTDPPPPPSPKATITTLTLTRGNAFQASVENVTGKVMVTFSRGGKRRKTATVTVRNNQITVTTKSLKRGTYRVGIWTGTTRLAAASVTIR